MSDQTIQEIVAQAVGQTFAQWSSQHPALSAVIDRVKLSDQLATSLRQSPEYQQALQDYNLGMTELSLLGRLMDLAGPILISLLGL